MTNKPLLRQTSIASVYYIVRPECLQYYCTTEESHQYATYYGCFIVSKHKQIQHIGEIKCEECHFSVSGSYVAQWTSRVLLS